MSTFEVSHSVNERIWVALSDSAHVSTSLDLEVSTDSPWCSPRVLDIPELHSFFLSETCGQNCVVNILSSLSTVVNWVDTSCIVLESSDNLEGHRDGSSIIESFSEFVFVTLSNIIAAVSAISNWNFGSVDTWVGNSLVGISKVRFQATSVSNIFESMGR